MSVAVLTRAQRDNARARRWRFELVVKLGGQCAECGDTTGDLLEIDHPNGRDWKSAKTSQLQRVRLYWREYLSGVPLRVLCRFCNRRDGGARRWNGRRYA